MYAYYLNMRSSEPWAGTIATKYKNVRGASINHLDTGNHTRYRYVKGGGWHFTNQGGADKIRMKLESYGHQEFNTEDTKAAIEERMLAGVDFIGRKFEFWTDESDLPDYLKNSKEKYSGMFTDKKK